MKKVNKGILTLLLAFIPLAIELLLILLTLYKNIGGVIWSTHFLIIILLFIIGMGLVSNKKLIQRIGIVALCVLTIFLSIIGYYDYIRWFSTIVGIVLFIYFAVVGMTMKKLKKL
ncbi:hypothetical protein [Clostridium baratii]|uniref:Uncharacterized protein n=1 Tax=Clostridium baratii TaxID=1561 RepID=A0A174Q3J7_9CLOT|nr:hypothetical protein [Clostridium baratii]CUP65468.1 Uncharacterised protein [Clostridium baratii]